MQTEKTELDLILEELSNTSKGIDEINDNLLDNEIDADNLLFEQILSGDITTEDAIKKDPTFFSELLNEALLAENLVAEELEQIEELYIDFDENEGTNLIESSSQTIVQLKEETIIPSPGITPRKNRTTA